GLELWPHHGHRSGGGCHDGEATSQDSRNNGRSYSVERRRGRRDVGCSGGRLQFRRCGLGNGSAGDGADAACVLGAAGPGVIVSDDRHLVVMLPRIVAAIASTSAISSDDSVMMIS